MHFWTQVLQRRTHVRKTLTLTRGDTRRQRTRRLALPRSHAHFAIHIKVHRSMPALTLSRAVRPPRPDNTGSICRRAWKRSGRCLSARIHVADRTYLPARWPRRRAKRAKQSTPLLGAGEREKPISFSGTGRRSNGYTDGVTQRERGRSGATEIAAMLVIEISCFTWTFVFGNVCKMV